MSGSGPSLGGAPGNPGALLPMPNTNQLITWKSGDALAAADLSWNFILLLNMIMSVAAVANQPQALALEARFDQRIGELERLEADALRERMTRPEYAKASDLSVIRQQIASYAMPVQRLQRESVDHTTTEDRLAARVASLEAKPPPPPAPSVAEHERLRAALIAGQQEIKQLRSEVLQSRADLFRARRALQEKEAPKAQPGVGYLLRRIEDLEHKPTLATQARLIERIDAIEKFIAGVRR